MAKALCKTGSTIESTVGLTLVQGHGFCPFICCITRPRQQRCTEVFASVGTSATSCARTIAMRWRDYTSAFAAHPEAVDHMVSRDCTVGCTHPRITGEVANGKACREEHCCDCENTTKQNAVHVVDAKMQVGRSGPRRSECSSK
jgi:hypothetical protein